MIFEIENRTSVKILWFSNKCFELPNIFPFFWLEIVCFKTTNRLMYSFGDFEIILVLQILYILIFGQKLEFNLPKIYIKKNLAL